MAYSIFQDSTTKLPKKDGQIVKINFEESQIGARKDHVPTPLPTGGSTAIRHVPNEGGRT
ncbi:MAG TPA: hypothetical protein VGR84_19010 [Candidatus Acidoferrales bacterium]|nr:hypothetical protein [Candidatus Acidoferrales bacterium]